MTTSDDKLQKLRGFGLSEYAARAYLALLQLGTTDARAVSRLSKIPIAKVYSTLDQLQTKGLVLVAPGQPKQYTPVPFRDFLAMLRRRHEDEIRQLEQAEEELVDIFSIRGTTEVDDRGAVLTLRGRENVLAKTRDLCDRAERDLVLLASAGAARRIRGLAPLLESAQARNVRFRILADLDAESAGLYARASEHAEIRARPYLPGAGANVSVLVRDEAEALLTHVVPDDSSLLRGSDVAILTSETGIVKSIAGMMEALWWNAEPLERRHAGLERHGLPLGTDGLLRGATRTG